MTKFLLAFLASSASVVVLLVTANFPFFSSHSATSLFVNKDVVNVKLADLNFASPSLGLTDSPPHILDANLGCSCPARLQFS